MNVFAQRVPRTFALFVLAVCSFALAFTLVGCGGNDKEEITKLVKTELDTLKDPTNSEFVSTLSSTESQLAELGITQEDLLTSWLDGYAYEVGEVTVAGDGKTATVKVNITCKKLYDVITAWQNTFYDRVMNEGLTSTADIQAFAGKTIVEDLKAATPSTTEITLNVEKGSSGWQIPSSNTENDNAIASALIGESSLSL